MNEHRSSIKSLSSDKDEKKERNWILATLWGIFMIALVKTFWPDVIPIPTYALWDSKTHFGDWIMIGLPLFGWGLFIQTYFEVKKRNDSPMERFIQKNTKRLFQSKKPTAERLFFGGIVLSVWAGFAEEIAFRWIIFLSSIVSVKIANFLFLGFIDINIVAWLHNNIFGVVADYATLGRMNDLLVHPSGWAVGAALLASNAFFRDGHGYQGLFGIVNSWFIGMFLFWVAFHHGLWASITIHFLYDFIVFTIAAIGYGIREDS